MTPDNDERATRAAEALLNYKHRWLGEDGPLCEDTVIDFLVDLLHALDRDRGLIPEADRSLVEEAEMSPQDLVDHLVGVMADSVATNYVAEVEGDDIEDGAPDGRR